MKKNKLLCLISLIAILVVSSVCAILAFADNANYQWSEITLSNEYYVYDFFTVPTAKVSDGTNEYNADFCLITPNGKSYTDDDNDFTTPSEFMFESAGEYQLVYTAVINGKAVVRTVKFTVSENLFSVSSANSSIEYGEFSYKYPDSEETRSRTGLKVSLAAGDTFSYNKVVSLNDMPSLAKIIEFYAMPETDRELDFSGLTVILTDVYDRSNQIEIKVKALINAKTQDKWDWTYLSACVPSIGQITSGYAKGASPEVQVDTIYGASHRFSFYGSSFNKKESAFNCSMPIYYNNTEKAVYVGTNLVADFDDTFFFSKLWDGFTSDKILVSVIGNTYYKQKANIVISELCGQNLSEDNVLNRNSIPEFAIDRNGVDLDNAVAVLGYKFPIFDAKAVDIYDGELPVSVKVFNSYYSSSKSELDIVDGCFVADRLGVVTIEYSAKTFDGNVFVKTVDVAVVADEIITAEFLTENQTGVAGTIFNIADFTVENNVGNVEKTISVIFNDKEVDITEGKFKAVSSGEYTVKVTVKDVIGQVAEDTYSVAVAKNPIPVFFGDAVVPKYFIVGKKYNLPEFNAYDYFSDVEKQVKTTIKVNGKECTDYTCEQEGIVTVEYIAKTVSGENVKTYNVKAVSVKQNETSLNLTKYFDAKDMSVTSNTLGVNLTVDSGKDSGKVTFINYVSAYGFSLDFAIAPEKDDFANLEISLVDVVDVNNSIKITIDPKMLKAYVNGELMNTVLSAKNLFDTTGKASINLSFDARSKVISLGSGTFNVVDFNGFTSGLLYLEIAINGVEQEGEVSVRKISNQVVRSNIKRDNIEPQISFNGSYELYAEINQTQKVYSAVITDVLNPITESYVSVTAPDGSFVTATNGTLLNKADAGVDYEFIFSNYGTYKVKYYAKDADGNSETGVTNNITVVDKEPPEVNVDGKIPTSVKFGSVVKIPKVVATDNIDEELTVNVVIYNTYTGFRTLLKEDEFTVKYVGDYVVTFVCYDAAGNVSSKSFTIKVEV